MDWMKHKLESRLLGEISITLDMHIIPPFCQKQRRTKEFLDEGKRGEGKSWLKTQHKVIATGPITSWKIAGEALV